jgi:Xaa-Pro aminopeptidase
VRSHAAEAQRVAIRHRTRDPSGAEAARAAGHVLNDDGLSERYLHALRQETRGDVIREAGRKRHDHGDRTGWIDLRLNPANAGAGNGEHDEQVSHGYLPSVHEAPHSDLRVRIRWSVMVAIQIT